MLVTVRMGASKVSSAAACSTDLFCGFTDLGHFQALQNRLRYREYLLYFGSDYITSDRPIMFINKKQHLGLSAPNHRVYIIVHILLT